MEKFETVHSLVKHIEVALASEKSALGDMQAYLDMSLKAAIYELDAPLSALPPLKVDYDTFNLVMANAMANQKKEIQRLEASLYKVTEALAEDGWYE